MIISRTPLRISFAGGGTDLAVFYKKEGGEVISTAIDKYMYVTVNKRFDDSIRLSYTKTEIVDHVDELHHELVREAMKLTGVTKGVEITTIADVPAKGTGLGSSSSLTVGLLNALYGYKGERVTPRRLAEEACKLEIDIVGEPIGKQDQYIAAFGGLKHIIFKESEDVVVEPVLDNKNRMKRLEGNLMLFYTNISRDAGIILGQQKANSHGRIHILRDLKAMVGEFKSCLEKKRSRLEDFGYLLNKGWELKKKMTSSITNHLIDDWYKKALDAGALGGKVVGAGGGGFMLLYCKKKHQKTVRKALSELHYMPIKFEQSGSRIIYAER
ncbi:MAG: GHMP kinase [Candidatus Omnitrophota bacterium]